MIGLAQTGSGKTGSFALPILQHLLDAPQALFALVLSPTRELAIQIAEQFEALGAGIGVKCAVLVGGIDMMAQVGVGGVCGAQGGGRVQWSGAELQPGAAGGLAERSVHFGVRMWNAVFLAACLLPPHAINTPHRIPAALQAIALAKRPHVVVGTPGRVVDHLSNTKGFSLKALRHLVLDEADRLLNMDFEQEIDQILKVIPKVRAVAPAAAAAARGGCGVGVGEWRAAECGVCDGARLHACSFAASAGPSLSTLVPPTLLKPCPRPSSSFAACCAPAPVPPPPQERRTQLFSATMTSKVAKLQRACLRDPVKVEVASKYSTVDTLRQQYMFVPAKHKDCYLVYLLTGACGGGGVGA